MVDGAPQEALEAQALAAITLEVQPEEEPQEMQFLEIQTLHG